MKNWLIYLNLLIPFIVKMFIPDGRYGSITIITDMIILPATLMILNITLYLNKIEPSFLKCCLLMLIGLLIGNLIGYIIWGFSTKNLLNPDAETLWIQKSLLI